MSAKTVLEEIVASLTHAASYNRDAEERPSAILWTDKDEKWRPLIAKLQEALPQLFLLGEYAPDRRQGPAIWLKCVEARVLPEVQYSEGAVPIFYLPRVSRTELRLVNTCPVALQPLAELQWRGVYWSQKNGKDWTVNAFLTSAHGGLGLEVAQDQGTQAALTRALKPLLAEKVVHLAGHQLQADDFDRLLDVVVERDVVAWMNAPAGTRDDWGPERWAAFAQRVRATLGFDPEADTGLSAAHHLAEAKDGWAKVWERYAESAAHYPNIPALLEKAPLPADFFADKSRYPQHNAREEATLRAELMELPNKSRKDARAAINALEAAHRERRQWVWASMGRARLAQALEHLHRIVQLSAQSYLAHNPTDMAARYADAAWQVDAEMVDALAKVETTADTSAVELALKAVYVPWLEELAHHFQGLIKTSGYPLTKPGQNAKADDEGVCVFFVDGLRFDAGRRLARHLEQYGAKVNVSTRWSALPSVTASGKVLVSPAAVFATGTPSERDFEPVHKASLKPLNAQELRKTLCDGGWQILDAEDPIGDPKGKAWTETGDLDDYGHKNQLALARDLSARLRMVEERIRQLLDAGWKRIRVVTDHGWLLVPGRLPKVALPKDLTDTRWGRCAVLKDSTKPTPLTFGWTWCDEVAVAMAPGIATFAGNDHYAHGGLTLQESVIPVLDIHADGASVAASVNIKSLKWRGLRLYVDVEPADFNAYADLRGKAAKADTSMVEAAELAEGKASLLVSDDGLEGSTAVLVIVDEAGRVLAQQPVIIGG